MDRFAGPKLALMRSTMEEDVIDTTVTYVLEQNGRFMLIQNVPARVCRETGEQYFSPQTVERIHALIRSRNRPARVVETPVYEYEA